MRRAPEGSDDNEGTRTTSREENRRRGRGRCVRRGAAGFFAEGKETAGANGELVCMPYTYCNYMPPRTPRITILRKAADVLQNKLTRAQYLDEVTWTTKNWLGLQKQRISVVLHTAIAEQL